MQIEPRDSTGASGKDLERRETEEIEVFDEYARTLVYNWLKGKGPSANIAETIRGELNLLQVAATDHENAAKLLPAIGYISKLLVDLAIKEQVKSYKMRWLGRFWWLPLIIGIAVIYFGLKAYYRVPVHQNFETLRNV